MINARKNKSKNLRPMSKILQPSCHRLAYSPFIIWSKCSPTNTEGDPTLSHWSAAGSVAGGTTGQIHIQTLPVELEDSGYEVVFERDGGMWELNDKVQHRNHASTHDAHDCTDYCNHHLTSAGYRRSEPNKTKYVAKHVCEGSHELAIHKYLQSRRSQSPYINSFIEAIPSTTREWLVLPFATNGAWVNMVSLVVSNCWGLIKGLAFLHEHKIAHRDIKPDNLVRDHDFNLKIIDFDVAIKVEDENTEINGYCGTKGWTAPEIGKEDGPTPMYSPIKADEWSCGRVILRHIIVG